MWGAYSTTVITTCRIVWPLPSQSFPRLTREETSRLLIFDHHPDADFPDFVCMLHVEARAGSHGYERDRTFIPQEVTLQRLWISRKEHHGAYVASTYELGAQAYLMLSE